MLSVSEAEARCAQLIEAAQKAGADAADAIYIGDGSTSVQVRLGALEDVERSEGEEIGLRLFVGRRSASVSSSDLSRSALLALVERAVAMAREAPEDPYAGLAPEERLIQGSGPDVEGDDGGDPSPAALKARAMEMEEIARGHSGITNSEGAGDQPRLLPRLHHQRLLGLRQRDCRRRQQHATRLCHAQRALVWRPR
jgi:PmbA protein